MPAHFALGRVVITRNALNTLPADDVHNALARRAAGDWGDVCEEDRQEEIISSDAMQDAARAHACREAV